MVRMNPIDLNEVLASFDAAWSPRIVTRVNDYDIRLARFAGEHVWHVHENTDEFFLVLDGEPAGWCAIEPRTAYRRLLRSRLVWDGRDEDPADDGVWAVTCFVTRKGFRRRGVSAALAKAAADFARERRARAVEGYPIAVEPGQQVAWPGELFVGTAAIFAAAGFTEVSRPTP